MPRLTLQGICERVIESKEGQLTLVTCFDTATFHQDKPKDEPSAPKFVDVKYSVAVRVNRDDFEKPEPKTTFVYRLIPPGRRKPLYEMTFDLDLSERLSAQFVITHPRMAVEGFGQYRHRFLVQKGERLSKIGEIPMFLVDGTQSQDTLP